MNLIVKEIETTDEMLNHFEMIKHLYPEFTKEYYKELLEQMLPNNYRQVVVYENGKCVGLSGFWVGTKLWCGKYLELDNFIVHPEHRSKGIGKILDDYLLNRANALGCKMMALDAYTHNFAAHKFYYNQGYVPKGFHFVKFLENNQS